MSNAIATVTVTGKAGPGLTLTAAVFNNVTQFRFVPANAIFYYTVSGIENSVAISAATTITVVLSAASGNYTVTIS